MNCIRRFISRRGTPQKFLSDNGKSFVSSSKELQQGIDRLKKSTELAEKPNLEDKNFLEFLPSGRTSFRWSLGMTSTSLQVITIWSDWLPNTYRRHPNHIHMWDRSEHELASYYKCPIGQKWSSSAHAQSLPLRKTLDQSPTRYI